MKIFVSILLILSSVIFTEIIVDLCNMTELKHSLAELGNEGKTDTDTTEIGEEDSELEYFNLSSLAINASLTRPHKENNFSAFGHFQEIPDPPPEV